MSSIKLLELILPGLYISELQRWLVPGDGGGGMFEALQWTDHCFPVKAKLTGWTIIVCLCIEEEESGCVGMVCCHGNQPEASRMIELAGNVIVKLSLGRMTTTGAWFL